MTSVQYHPSVPHSLVTIRAQSALVGELLG